MKRMKIRLQPVSRAINYLSMCATSIPSGVTDNQLPTSIQIACRGGDEITSLQIAAAYETIRKANPAPPCMPKFLIGDRGTHMHIVWIRTENGETVVETWRLLP